MDAMRQDVIFILGIVLQMVRQMTGAVYLLYIRHPNLTLNMH